MKLRSAVRSIVRRTGYDIHKYPLSAGVPHREHLAAILRRLNVNCVLDVGGHFGEFGRLLRVIGYKERIVSFEPVVQSFRQLATVAARDHDWRVNNCALGATPGELAIKVAKFSDLSSFLSPSEYSKTTVFGTQLELEREEKVCVRTLDQVFDDCISGIAVPRPFLKMDTQGYDLQVLAGGNAHLGTILGLQSEVSVLPLYDEAVPYLQAIARLASLGFEVTGLFPVNCDGLSRVIEFDCVAVKCPPGTGVGEEDERKHRRKSQTH